jgi:hypothetical protein
MFVVLTFLFTTALYGGLLWLGADVSPPTCGATRRPRERSATTCCCRSCAASRRDRTTPRRPPTPEGATDGRPLSGRSNRARRRITGLRSIGVDPIRSLNMEILLIALLLILLVPGGAEHE